MKKMFYTFRTLLPFYNLPNAKHHHDMGKHILFTVIILLKETIAFCQIQGPQMPQFPATQQVFNGGQNQQIQMGGTAQDIINQQNRNSHNPQASLEQERYRQQQRQKDYEEAMKDANRSFPVPIQYSLPSHANESDAKAYFEAYDELNKMLTGRAAIDIKKAVFLVENAYFGNTMKYEQYNSQIEDIAHFCRLRAKQEKLDFNSNEAKNDLLFRLMSDTLTVKDAKTGKIITHHPVHYDFDDPFGYNDWSKMFVTKLMATNYGQCHSMPLLYLILANEIGAKAYLATSPSHSYIKYRSGQQWKNVELTNGHMTTDAYVIGSGYIKSEALKNHIYMDTLSAKQTIAYLMEDLSKGYSIKYGEDIFVLNTVNTSLQYYPTSWNGMGQKADYYTVLFKYIVKQANEKGYNTPQQVLGIPQAKKAYDQMHGMYDVIDNSGYTEMPEAAYEDWLKSMDEQKRKQQREEFEQWKKLNKSTIKIPSERN
jgi:hypothetical protein